jgi:hypothetical protein
LAATTYYCIKDGLVTLQHFDEQTITAATTALEKQKVATITATTTVARSKPLRRRQRRRDPMFHDASLSNYCGVVDNDDGNELDNNHHNWFVAANFDCKASHDG